jgi:hypothetical protein
MFPGMSTTDARSAIGKMSLMGIGTFDEDGKFQVDYELLKSVFPSAVGGGDGGTPEDVPDVPLAEAYDAFVETIPSGEEGGWSYAKWVRDGKPTTFDKYQESTGGETENAEAIATLFTSTNGNLANQAPATITMVTDAIRDGDETVKEQFGVSNDELTATLVSGWFLGKTSPSITNQSAYDTALSNATGKVLTLTPEQNAVLQLKAMMNPFEPDFVPTPEQIKAYVDETSEQFGNRDVTLVVDRVYNDLGNAMITLRDPVTGVQKNVQINYTGG